MSPQGNGWHTRQMLSSLSPPGAHLSLNAPCLLRPWLPLVRQKDVRMTVVRARSETLTHVHDPHPGWSPALGLPPRVGGRVWQSGEPPTLFRVTSCHQEAEGTAPGCVQGHRQKQWTEISLSGDPGGRVRTRCPLPPSPLTLHMAMQQGHSRPPGKGAGEREEVEGEMKKASGPCCVPGIWAGRASQDRALC